MSFGSQIWVQIHLQSNWCQCRRQTLYHAVLSPKWMSSYPGKHFGTSAQSRHFHSRFTKYKTSSRRFCNLLVEVKEALSARIHLCRFGSDSRRGSPSSQGRSNVPFFACRSSWMTLYSRQRIKGIVYLLGFCSPLQIPGQAGPCPYLDCFSAHHRKSWRCRSCSICLSPFFSQSTICLWIGEHVDWTSSLIRWIGRRACLPFSWNYCGSWGWRWTYCPDGIWLEAVWPRCWSWTGASSRSSSRGIGAGWFRSDWSPSCGGQRGPNHGSRTTLQPSRDSWSSTRNLQSHSSSGFFASRSYRNGWLQDRNKRRSWPRSIHSRHPPRRLGSASILDLKRCTVRRMSQTWVAPTAK